jgi:hypothetical protein
VIWPLRNRRRALVGWKPGARNPHVASTRIRCFEPLEELRAQGYPVELYRHHRRRQYGVVVFQKLYDPPHLALARELRSRGITTVFDLSDNLFANPANHPKVAERTRWVEQMVAEVDVVTASTPAVASLLSRSAITIRDGVRPAELVIQRPTTARRATAGDGWCEVAWYGLWGGAQAPAGMQDLRRIASLLRELNEQHPLRLNVISNSRSCFEATVRPLPIPTRYWEWGSVERFYRLFPQMDLCVLPIGRNPFTMCKSPNRVTLALYLGVAVVADEIPSYREFAPFCRLGHWRESLAAYLADPALRRSDAERGREYVSSHYLTRHAAAEWSALFDRLLATGPVARC